MEFVWTATPGLLDRFVHLAVIHPLKIRLQAFVLRQSASVSLPRRARHHQWMAALPSRADMAAMGIDAPKRKFDLSTTGHKSRYLCPSGMTC